MNESSVLTMTTPVHSVQAIHTSLQQIVSNFADVQEEKINNAVLSSKAVKLEAKQTKVKVVLDCLSRYTYLIILNIAKMPNNEVQKLQCEARRKEMGEYQFISLELFIKQVIPHIKQFKERRFSKSTLKDLIKGQIGLFFSNKDILEVKQFIESFIYHEKLELQLSAIPRDFVIAKEDLRWSSNRKTHFFEYFNKLGIRHCYNHTLRLNELEEDWKVERGTQLDSVLRDIINEAAKLNLFYLTPYEEKLKILLILERDMQVPFHLLDDRKVAEEVVIKSLRSGFDNVRAIEMERMGKVTDFSENTLAISRFVEHGKLVLLASEFLNELMEHQRNNFDNLGFLLGDFADDPKSENQEEFTLEPLGDY